MNKTRYEWSELDQGASEEVIEAYDATGWEVFGFRERFVLLRRPFRHTCDQEQSVVQFFDGEGEVKLEIAPGLFKCVRGEIYDLDTRPLGPCPMCSGPS